MEAIKVSPVEEEMRQGMKVLQRFKDLNDHGVRKLIRDMITISPKNYTKELELIVEAGIVDRKISSEELTELKISVHDSELTLNCFGLYYKEDSVSDREKLLSLPRGIFLKNKFSLRSLFSFGKK